jgi:Tol biopolymer transport system component
MLRLTGLAILAALVGLVTLAARADSAVTARIVYQASIRGNNEIMVVASGGGTPTRLTRVGGGSWDGNPTWSAGGQGIAFESNRHGDIDVYVMSARGTAVRQLTFSDAYDGDPAWSWLGQIAFESERTGSVDVWAIAPDGSDETRLTRSPAFDGDPAWSPDGSKIVFTSERDNGDREVYVMNADGSGQTRLTASSGFDENPSWSPDGKRIAFDSTRDGNLEIYVMNADGSKQTRVTNHPSLDALPSWSQDSKRIVFVSDRSRKGQRRLYTARADGSGLRMLTRGVFDMSPDWARG